VIEAIVLGALAQASLVLTGLSVYVVNVPTRIVGLIAGYGVGALLGAIAFELVPEAKALTAFEIGLWFVIGAAVFIVADTFVEQRFAGGKDVADEGADSPLGIVVGSVVDGVPESIIFGIGIATQQPISAAFLAAVFISNIPQALAPSADLAKQDWKPLRMVAMWSAVLVACGLAAGVGYLMPQIAGDATGARAAAFAAGGLLAMLTDSLIPFAYRRAGRWAGVACVTGFALSVMAA
jgi:zinc transporter, ZIP family